MQIILCKLLLFKISTALNNLSIFQHCDFELWMNYCERILHTGLNTLSSTVIVDQCDYPRRRIHKEWFFMTDQCARDSNHLSNNIALFSSCIPQTCVFIFYSRQIFHVVDSPKSFISHFHYPLTAKFPSFLITITPFRKYHKFPSY